jgi:hypothetical protein
MRALALRFRGILRGGDAEKLAVWLHGADRSELYGVRRFVHTLRQDLDAVRNAVTEPWSNGQTEGQSAEDAEAPDVWTRRRRTASCADDPLRTRSDPHELRQNLIEQPDSLDGTGGSSGSMISHNNSGRRGEGILPHESGPIGAQGF